ncbi:GNAT family N-acetyltransferase [Heyndrickxia oleronia]|uniref:GNAT family N-acetyltransferase n=1 Tax=Heyndrickxia oleronia TaxID=38875 RepID=A0A8E2I2U9_9BACI|nr:GNAT family N-acetyltransferase [Heyndrickxia oleronia]MEC1375818.1 GNAT family N-acetyltransferase [Heyndrickxia oleronia]OOP65380.1 GNAT family N-acetyltransferase [Heyndrickxia oleronia]QQZ02833.1 GNAT family N-acetyltransferase [Heyndrickxia oleronia]
MEIRLAEEKDIDQLIKMRWDFTIEEDYENKIQPSAFEDFKQECRTFLEKYLDGDQWFIWIAEDEGIIVSHIYIEIIQKVPRPGRITKPFAYMTNVYTVKEYRNKGIGSRLLSRINEWVKENNYEFVIVWPSDDSVNFYQKNGYVQCTEPMEYFPN